MTYWELTLNDYAETRNTYFVDGIAVGDVTTVRPWAEMKPLSAGCLDLHGRARIIASHYGSGECRHVCDVWAGRHWVQAAEARR